MLEFLLNVEYVDAWEKLRSLSLSLARARSHAVDVGYARNDLLASQSTEPKGRCVKSKENQRDAKR